MFLIQTFLWLTLVSLLSVEAAPKNEIDVPKKTIPAGRCFTPGCWKKKLGFLHGGGSQSCPNVDVSSVNNKISDVSNKVSAVRDKVNQINDIKKSINSILAKVGKDSVKIESSIEKHMKDVKKSIKTDITNIQKNVENVQTAIINNSCNKSSNSSKSGGGDVSGLKSQIDIVIATLNKLNEQTRESDILTIVKDTMKNVITIKQSIADILYLKISSGETSKPVQCSDSPVVISMQNTNEKILNEVRTAVNSITQNSQEIISVISNTSLKGGSRGADFKWLMAEILSIKEIIKAVQIEFIDLKTVFTNQFGQFQTQIMSRFEKVESIRTTLQVDTTEIATSVASAAAKEVRKWAGRNLCEPN